MKDLTILLENTTLEKTKAQTTLDSFTEFFNQAAVWEKKVNELVVTDASQVKEMELARTGRLELKDLRINAEKTKKRLKENILIEGKFIDSIYNAVVGVVKPLEDNLYEKEKFVENQIIAEKEEKIRKRLELLSPYDVDTSCYDFSIMPDAIFDKLVADSKELFDRREEDLRKEEEARQAEADKKAAEQEEIRLENIRLKKEKEESEKAQKEKDEAARKEQEKKDEAARIEQAKKDAILEKEREEQAEKEKKLREEKAESDRKLAEKEKEIADQKKADKEKKEKEAADLKAKEEKEKKAKAEAERKAKLAPDKEKLRSYLDNLLLVSEPGIKDVDLKKILAYTRNALVTARANIDKID